MNGVPALSLLLAANSLQIVLIVVLVILGALVVAAMLGGLVVFLRRGGLDRLSAASEPPMSGLATPDAGTRPQPEPGHAPASGSPVPPAVIGPRPPVPPPPAVPESPGASVPPQPPPAEVEAPAGAVPPAPMDAAPPATHPEAELDAATSEGSPAPMSPTQTPADVDQRSPAELAAAAQSAEAAPDQGPSDANGSGPAGVMQHEGAIGPPRPQSIASTAPPDPARLRMLGLTLGILTERMRREHPPQLGTALARLVDADQEAARSQLSTLALSLLGEDEEPSMADGQLSLFLEEALDGELERGFSFSAMPEFQQALSAVAPELREKLQTIVWARNADSVAILTTDDVEALERVAVAMATALMIDTSYDMRRLPDDAPSGHA